MKPKHDLSISERRAVFKAFCNCGWQSGRSRDKRDVVHAYREHLRLVQREDR